MAKNTDNEIVNSITRALEERNAYKNLLDSLLVSGGVGPTTKVYIKTKVKEIKARK